MRSTRHLSLLVLLLATAAGLRDADAESFHEKEEARPITKGGAVVGMRVVVTLRPDGSQPRVKVGLGKRKNSFGSTNYQTAATDPAKGYLIHQWPEIEVPGKAAKEVTLEVLFADVPDLKPGDDVDLVTAWVGSSRTHVWGMSRQGVTARALKVPGTPPPAASAGDTTARTARTRMTHQRRAMLRRHTARARRR